MAEVFRAILVGASGFEKPLAVKRILPVFGAEPDFITLFEDEARIASTLTHVNIAQVFEFGEVAGSPYIAMELVDGLDLARLMQRLRAAEHPMPLATAAFIVAEAARGLAYAHDRGVIHRDASPPNVLISYEGEVKVADFGIAKAATKVHKTETGVIMGKLRYMSPEQLESEPIDARSDIFSLGVILYELVTGGPIHRGDPGLRLAELIRTADVPPPSTRNRDVPPALDGIVLRALARRRDDRYPRAAELARDLSLYVSSTAPSFTREDLGALVRSLAPRTSAEIAVMPTALAPSPAPPARPPTALAPAPTRSLAAPSRRRRRRLSAETLLGVLLAAIILASSALVLVRFVLPGREPAAPDARRLASGPDAGRAAEPEPPPTSAFALRATASAEEKRALAAQVDRFLVARRGVAAPDYLAYLTGLDTGLALLSVDADGRAQPPAPLPERIAALVARAGAGEAVAATLEYVRQTGELPEGVKDGARALLRAQPSSVGAPAERVAPYAAAGLAVWLEPRNRARLGELAYANDLFGRWCEPVPPPARHFAPLLCERAALVAALRAGDPRDGTAEALERWAQAAPDAPDAEWADATLPGELVLTVHVAADSVTLFAAGTPPVTGRDVLRVPRRIVAPVLRVGDQTFRLPPPSVGP
jgi:hypothetical protein